MAGPLVCSLSIGLLASSCDGQGCSSASSVADALTSQDKKVFFVRTAARCRKYCRENGLAQSKISSLRLERIHRNGYGSQNKSRGESTEARVRRTKCCSTLQTYVRQIRGSARAGSNGLEAGLRDADATNMATAATAKFVCKPRVFKSTSRCVLHLRGGDSSGSKSAPNDAGRGPFWGALRALGIGSTTEAVAKARMKKATTKAGDDEAAKAREASREGREQRLEREVEVEETWIGKAALSSGYGVDRSGIMSAAAAGDAIAAALSDIHVPGLWLEAAEDMMGAMAIFMTSLWPLWHTVRAMFGLSMLFYGQEFATLAFHVVVFRLCGWKKAARSKDELVAYYKSARQAMRTAASGVLETAAIIAQKDSLKARKEEMMAEKKQLLKMGRVTTDEARAFIDKYRNDIEIIAREQEALATASSSILAIKSAVNLKKLSESINSLYAAMVTSVTASTFKMAGQLTLAVTCGGLIKKTLLDLLGPIIDPIGYQIELETYVAKIVRGRANLYLAVVGFVVSAAMFFHFVVDPHRAVNVTLVLLGARVVTDYVVAALNPLRSKFGMVRKLDNMPASAVIYIVLAALGFIYQNDAGVIGAYVCRPYIAFLGKLNVLLNRFQISTISYFS